MASMGSRLSMVSGALSTVIACHGFSAHQAELTMPLCLQSHGALQSNVEALERAVKLSLGAGAKPAEVCPSASRSCADVTAPKQRRHSAAGLQAEPSGCSPCIGHNAVCRTACLLSDELLS